MEEFKKLKALCGRYGILFVDDDVSTLNSIGSVLSKIFKNVFLCANAKEALDSFEKNGKNIHIVMSDIVLGGDSGLDLIEVIRAKDGFKKFIIASGYGSNEYLSKAIRLGVASFLLKPISANDLFASLTQAAERVKQDMLLSAYIANLKKAKLKAQELLKKQDRFIKDAIHELGTPLSVIMSAKDLIAIEKGGSVHLDNIEAACRSLQNSFEDMSYLMKKDTAKFTPRLTDVSDFVAQRIDFFAPVAIANRLGISFTPASEKFYFEIPHIKLQRLIDNNISNAIKYSNRGSDILLSTEMTADGLALEFKNVGKPIADVKKIFERFYREDNVKGGYGIGLSLVAQICKEYGIEIFAKSDKNGNTSFKYIFPIQSKRKINE